MAVEPDNAVPNEEAAHVEAGKQGEPGCTVSPGESEPVSASGEHGRDCWESDERGEECPEASLGLPDAEPLVIIVKVGFPLDLRRTLFSQFAPNERLPLQQLIDLVQ